MSCRLSADSGPTSGSSTIISTTVPSYLPTQRTVNLLLAPRWMALLQSPSRVKTTDSVCAFREELSRLRQTGSLRVQMERNVMAGCQEKMEQKVGGEIRQLRQDND
ncbi:hypothetical protein MRS44_009767 [Fusarium solani]|uniref:uncharacterized protein n=1 Tax=Fusarium solani TaxID=169388 RepID=UPI0032C461C8|nr:hypothetical protein MRS44_009767 [Fusarium solani]